MSCLDKMIKNKFKFKKFQKIFQINKIKEVLTFPLSLSSQKPVESI